MEFALKHLCEIDDSYLGNWPVGIFFADQKSELAHIDWSLKWRV
jgi:hypothetical protein